MTTQMHNPQAQLLRELGWKGITQASVAITYAYIIAQEGGRADWPRIHAAIGNRWAGKTALVRIKEQAWKQVEAWSEAAASSSPSRAATGLGTLHKRSLYS